MSATRQVLSPCVKKTGGLRAYQKALTRELDLAMIRFKPYAGDNRDNHSHNFAKRLYDTFYLKGRWTCHGVSCGEQRLHGIQRFGILHTLSAMAYTTSRMYRRIVLRNWFTWKLCLRRELASYRRRTHELLLVFVSQICCPCLPLLCFGQLFHFQTLRGQHDCCFDSSLRHSSSCHR